MRKKDSELIELFLDEIRTKIVAAEIDLVKRALNGGCSLVGHADKLS